MPVKVIEVGTNRKTLCDFLLVINSNWQPISDRFRVIAAYCSNLDTLCFWATLWGLRDNVRCSSWAHWKARSGLPICDNWTFFTRCYARGAMGENRSKISDFAPTRSVWPKISGRRGRPPPIIFVWIVSQWMPYSFAADNFHTRNFVADFLQAKCDFRGKTTDLRFWAPPLGDLGATYDDHVRLIGDFLLVLFC